MTRQRHIILAEDETHVRTTLALIFKKAGYKVTAVEDGRKTFALLPDTHQKDEVPDLPLTDIQMPGLNGIGLIDELKKNNIAHPILVITGFPYPDKKKDKKKVESIITATFTDLVSDKMTTATWFAGLSPLLKINSGDIREYLPGLDFTGSRISGIFWRR